MTSDLINSLDYQNIDCTNDDIERKNQVNNLLDRNHKINKELKNNKAKIDKILNKKTSNYQI